MIVDLLHNVRVLDDQLQRNDISGSVNALVRSCTTDQGGLLGVVRVSFRYGPGSDEGSKEIAFNGLGPIVPAGD
jgi:hypothetical protein